MQASSFLRSAKEDLTVASSTGFQPGRGTEYIRRAADNVSRARISIPRGSSVDRELEDMGRQLRQLAEEIAHSDSASARREVGDVARRAGQIAREISQAPAG